MSILRLENVRYNNILKCINFSIDEGSFNVLIGPNSSGKSTLIKILAELMDFDGKIIFDGERKDIGFFMEYNLFSYKKVIDNLIFILLNLGFKKKYSEEKANEFLKYFDLEYLVDKQISDLTFSEKRLVEFVSSIIHEPKLIIIDDSFDYLSKSKRKEMLKKIKNLKTTVLFVTNSVDDIFFADQIIIIKDGVTTFAGDLEDLIKDEKNFIANEIYPPFILDLSYKFLDYNLIDKIILNEKEMVNNIWK